MSSPQMDSQNHSCHHRKLTAERWCRWSCCGCSRSRSKSRLCWAAIRSRRMAIATPEWSSFEKIVVADAAAAVAVDGCFVVQPTGMDSWMDLLEHLEWYKERKKNDEWVQVASSSFIIYLLVPSLEQHRWSWHLSAAHLSPSELHSDQLTALNSVMNWN